MKRQIETNPSKTTHPKKPKPEQQQQTPVSVTAVLADDNLLYEVLKHADARTLARSACVNNQWRITARDERLWELICTRQWANMGCAVTQLRSVVLALGGFRNLHSLYLVPLSKPVIGSSSSSSSSSWKGSHSQGKTKWGKDEVQLSLSLLSIRYFEKMNFGNKGKGI